MEFSKKLSTEDFLKLKKSTLHIKEANKNFIKTQQKHKMSNKYYYKKIEEEKEIQLKVDLILKYLLKKS